MGFFSDISTKLFGQEKKVRNKSRNVSSQKKDRRESFLSSEERAPYFIQVGFDFGTSFSKCIYREISKDKAWVYIPRFAKSELPFLIPSPVIFHNNFFKIHTDTEIQYPQHGLCHLKFAIERVACGDIDNLVLDRYKKAAGASDLESVTEFVRHCAVFYLASSFCQILKDIKYRFKDFYQKNEDQVAVTMAIPVADACQEQISSCYKKILKTAWAVAPKLAGKEVLSRDELIRIIETSSFD